MNAQLGAPLGFRIDAICEGREFFNVPDSTRCYLELVRVDEAHFKARIELQSDFYKPREVEVETEITVQPEVLGSYDIANACIRFGVYNRQMLAELQIFEQTIPIPIDPYPVLQFFRFGPNKLTQLVHAPA